MSKEFKGEPYYLPLDIVSASVGFSLDIGASAGKLVYRSKTDFANGKAIQKPDAQQENLGRVWLVRFSRTEIDDVISHIQNNCDIRNDVTEVGVTGVGCNYFNKKLEDALKLKLRVYVEFYCFVEALQTLSTYLPREKLFLPPSVEGLQRGEVYKRAMFRWREALKEHSANYRRPEPEITDVKHIQGTSQGIVFPCIYVVCGSHVTVHKLDADGTDTMVEIIHTGGLFFLAISALATGKHDFRELLTEAEKSDGRSVDMYISDAVVDSGSDVYGKAASEDYLMYPFGKGETVPRDAIVPGDAVRSALQVACFNIGSIVPQVAQLYGIRHIYFTGSFVENDLARALVTERLYWRQYRTAAESSFEFEFIRAGGFLGALGAFLQAKDNQA